MVMMDGVKIIWTLEAQAVMATYCVSPLARALTGSQAAVLGE